MEFNDSFGVYVCQHVFKLNSPILLCVRDESDWQFLCGDQGCPNTSEPHLVGIGHLINRDSSIFELINLKPNSFAQKIHANANWEIETLE